ncbi:MAG: integrase [Oleiphilaceae bacterium]|jgi:integrase
MSKLCTNTSNYYLVHKDDQGMIKNADYDVGKLLEYKVEDEKSDTRDARSPAPTKVRLTDNIIKRLPFCSDKPIDIVDTTFNAENDGGRLLLRIGKKTKTFYPSIAKRGNEKRGNGKSLGRWILKNSNYYKSNEANLYTAKARFLEVIKNHQYNVKIARQDGDITIREYIESGKYAQDRLTTSTLRNKISPVSKKTIASILRQFEPWLDKALSDVSKEWPAEFKKHWQEKYTEYNIEGRNVDPEIFKPKQIEVGTMRKYFGEINAMFNICEKIGYIHSNKIKSFASLFPKKSVSRGAVQTYKLNYDSLMTYLFYDDTPSPPFGKLIIAIMAVTGARNSEVYKNFIDNFNYNNGKLMMHIPAEICKTKEAGSRTVEIKHERVKAEVRKHLDEIPRNGKGHMFPSRVIMDHHVSDYAYRELWKLVKAFFDLPADGRMYSLRATFGTHIAKQGGIDVAADILGDSLEIANLHYNNVDIERKSDAMDKVFNENKDIVIAQNSLVPNFNTVYAAAELLPESISKLFSMFKNGKAEPSENHILKSDWDKFVNLIKGQFEAKKINDLEVEMWLSMQS